MQILYFARFRYLTIVLFSSVIAVSSCTKLRVYAPQNLYNHTKEKESNSTGKIKVQASYDRRDSFAVHKDGWFRDAVHSVNGPIEQIIETAMNKNPEHFVQPTQTLTLDIREFILFSNESFTNSVSTVILHVDIKRDGKPPVPFEFQKTIHSAVSDSMGFLATITLVGWIIYGPYIGFRGTLEDQLNYLGRLAVAELFKELAIKSEREIP